MLKGVAALTAVAIAVGGCGRASNTRTVTITRTSATTSPTSTPRPVVLAIPAVGVFSGRCPRNAKIWTLRFAAPAAGASETVISRLGRGPRRRQQVNPGQSISFHLTSGTARVREPADPMSGHHSTAVTTTAPLDVRISQATEPQSLRLDITLALTAIGGESGECVLADSRVDARTYFNGTQ